MIHRPHEEEYIDLGHDHLALTVQGKQVREPPFLFLLPGKSTMLDTSSVLVQISRHANGNCGEFAIGLGRSANLPTIGTRLANSPQMRRDIEISGANPICHSRLLMSSILLIILPSYLYTVISIREEDITVTTFEMILLVVVRDTPRDPVPVAGQFDPPHRTVHTHSILLCHCGVCEIGHRQAGRLKDERDQGSVDGIPRFQTLSLLTTFSTGATSAVAFWCASLRSSGAVISDLYTPSEGRKALCLLVKVCFVSRLGDRLSPGQRREIWRGT